MGIQNLFWKNWHKLRSGCAAGVNKAKKVTEIGECPKDRRTVRSILLAIISIRKERVTQKGDTQEARAAKKRPSPHV
jgi:hypothetical protein